MPHNYGLISQVDAKAIEDTLDLVMKKNESGVINFCEVGIYAGQTANGVRQYIESKGRKCYITGIDNFKDGEPLRFTYDRLIQGDSKEVYWQVEDKSQDVVFVDGDHSYLGVIADFYAYSPKVKKGGYLIFHDTGRHIKPFTDFQHGDKENPDAYISCRKALFDLALLPESVRYQVYGIISRFELDLVFDVANENEEAGGICCFKKL